METIILASGSPRRQELLSRAHIPFKAFPPSINEDAGRALGAAERVKLLAAQKIEKVVSLFKQESPRWVLGVDTLVELDGGVIDKPTGIEDAERILRLLSGQLHRVYSGIGLLPSRGEELDLRCVCTEVKFIELSSKDIEDYLLTSEWSAVAGAYRIQERGAFFVEWIKGSYSNVVGLPLETFYAMLRRSNYPF